WARTETARGDDAHIATRETLLSGGGEYRLVRDQLGFRRLIARKRVQRGAHGLPALLDADAEHALEQAAQPAFGHPHPLGFEIGAEIGLELRRGLVALLRVPLERAEHDALELRRVFGIDAARPRDRAADHELERLDVVLAAK